MIESQRIRQSQSGRVRELMQHDHRDEHRWDAVELRREQQKRAAQQMHESKQFFRAEVSVRDQAQEKRRHDRADRLRREGPVSDRFHPDGAHVYGDARIPCAPDEELQKRQQAQTRVQEPVHQRAER